MTPAQVSGTEGYTAEAEELFMRYESIPAADAHRAVLHLIPAAPGSVLDIGWGTGRDAAWFASQGLEPVLNVHTESSQEPSNTPPPKGSGFRLRLKAGFGPPFGGV